MWPVFMATRTLWLPHSELSRGRLRTPASPLPAQHLSFLFRSSRQFGCLARGEGLVTRGGCPGGAKDGRGARGRGLRSPGALGLAGWDLWAAVWERTSLNPGLIIIRCGSLYVLASWLSSRKGAHDRRRAPLGFPVA